jgi:hypothetical protein
MSPGAKEALPGLVKWLTRVPTLEWPSKKTPNWYTIGDVALATAVLDSGNKDVLEAIVVVAEASRKWIDEDESGVLDFERKLRQIAQTLGDPTALWGHFERLGIERVEDDRESDDDESEGKASELPDFPPERSPLPPLSVEPLPERVFHALADALSKAEEHARVPPGTDADGVAKAIDVTISRSHRNRQPLPDDVTAALGALWGKAVAQTTGWTWAHVVRGEAKYVCLVSKDRAYACAPLNFIKAQVDPKRETTALLLFNMIKAGKLPDSKAGQLLFLG